MDHQAYAPDSAQSRGELSGSAGNPQRVVPEERAAAGTDSAAPALPTVLVFRTQRVQTVADYAIVGDNLWDLSGPTPRKIPLASLDLDATARVNHDRGVEFRGPGR